jgi:error-prone DNA polymerase
MLADYSSTGLTTATHPLALLRNRLPGAATSRDLGRLEHGGRVRVGGLVVARQRPGTAGGVVFILLEDEHGTINLIVPPKVYERHRLIVRTEPLILVEGKLERFAAAGGAINVLVDRVGPIDAPDQILAEVKDFSMLDEQVRRGRAEQQAAAAAEAARPAARVTGGARGAGGGGGSGSEAEDFRAVAPPVMSFASGRRR